MMMLLAEIADKMPTIVGLWWVMILVSAVLVAIAATHRYAALPMSLIGLALSGWLLYSDYMDSWYGPLSDDIWRELGWPWVINLFASSTLPALAALVTCVIKWRARPDREPQALDAEIDSSVRETLP